MPKVSVIVPVYNVEKYIERCAHSLFRQTLEDVEYIFVDDCTPDRSIQLIQDILLSYPLRENSVKFVHHLHNKGLPAARETGIKHATGEYIIHSDSDDWMELDMLEKMYNKAILENADCVYCNFYFVTEAGRELYNTAQHSLDKATLLKNWINTKWTVIWNIMVKRDLYDDNVSFPTQVQFCEDFFLAIQLLCKSNKIVKIDTPLHNYNRLNVSSILHVAKKEKMEADAMWVYTNILYFLKRFNYFSLCDEAISWRYLNSIQIQVLDANLFDVYKATHPETHKYVWSCPYLNKKIKFMMWCLDNNLDFVVNMIIKLRTLLGR